MELGKMNFTTIQFIRNRSTTINCFELSTTELFKNLKWIIIVKSDPNERKRERENVNFINFKMP